MWARDVCTPSHRFCDASWLPRHGTLKRRDPKTSSTITSRDRPRRDKFPLCRPSHNSSRFQLNLHLHIYTFEHHYFKLDQRLTSAQQLLKTGRTKTPAVTTNAYVAVKILTYLCTLLLRAKFPRSQRCSTRSAAPSTLTTLYSSASAISDCFPPNGVD